MAGSRFLKWAEVKDFTPGLWTANAWNMPASAAQQMDDCQPDLGGGLRAAMKASSIVTTGLPTGAGITVAGLQCLGGKGPTGADSHRYLILKNGTNIQVWRFRDDLDVAWAQLGANIPTGGTGPNNIAFDVFVDSTAVTFLVFNIFQTAAQDGVWTINTSTGALNNRLAGGCTCVVVQDDRIIAAIGATLRWSDSQSVSSFPAANNLPLQISNEAANVVCMRAVAPNDIIVGFQYAPWVLVQGDIANPVVRGMSDARIPGGIQQFPLTTAGSAFVSFKRGAHFTSDGSSFQDISDQISNATWTTLDLGYCWNYLLSSTGLVYDFRTQSWATLSTVTAGAKVDGTVTSNEIMSAVYTANSPVLNKYSTDDSSRASSYTWKSAPFRGDDGRQIRIREVQVYAQSFSAAATIAVTVGGITRTVTLAASAKQQVDFLFDAYDEDLDVKVVAASNTSAEAPAIEVIRVGSLSGHQLR